MVATSKRCRDRRLAHVPRSSAFRSTSGTSGTDSQSSAAHSSGFIPAKSANTASSVDTQKEAEAKSVAKNDESKKDDDIVEATAVSSNFSPSAEMVQYLRISLGGICAFA